MFCVDKRNRWSKLQSFNQEQPTGGEPDRKTKMILLREKREFANEGVTVFAVNVDSVEETCEVVKGDVVETSLEELVEIMRLAAAADRDPEPMPLAEIESAIDNASWNAGRTTGGWASFSL
jgi:hypothetical protein